MGTGYFFDFKKVPVPLFPREDAGPMFLLVLDQWKFLSVV